jgi:hypothetical protein
VGIVDDLSVASNLRNAAEQLIWAFAGGAPDLANAIVLAPLASH